MKMNHPGLKEWGFAFFSFYMFYSILVIALGGPEVYTWALMIGTIGVIGLVSVSRMDDE